MTALRDDRSEADCDLRPRSRRCRACVPCDRRRRRGDTAARRRRCRRARLSSRSSKTWSAALYPRHFGPPDLAPQDVDAFVIRTLDTRAFGAPAPDRARARAGARMEGREPDRLAAESRRRRQGFRRSAAEGSQAPRQRPQGRLRGRPVGQEHRRDRVLLSGLRRDRPPPARARTL